MSIKLEINPALEKKLREKAARRGVDLDHFLQTELEKIGAADDPSPHPSKQLSKAESDLLQKINLGLSSEFWEKYRVFIKTKETRMLTESEVKEFILMNDQIEAANAKRMKYLVRLAQLREIPLRQLMEELGIKGGNYA